MSIYLIVLIIATFCSALSQLLLKRSAMQEHANWIKEYLNWRVITAYTIFVVVVLVNVYAFTKIDMRYGSVIDTLSYVFVMILSYFLLKEKFTKGQLIGNALIMLGVFIYAT